MEIYVILLIIMTWKEERREEGRKDRTEKKAMGRPLDSAFTVSQKQKRQGSKLNLTKRSN